MTKQFDTNVSPEENIHLFAVEYITTLWTSNENRDEEPVLFSIRDKADAADSIDELYQSLSEVELSALEKLLHDEQKWCLERLSEEVLNNDSIQQVRILNQAYQETIRFTNDWKAIA